MNSADKLTKLIEKAKEQGWKPFSFDIASVDYRKGKLERNMLITVHASDGEITIMYNLEAIIFNHDFAKSLFGEGKLDNDDNTSKYDFYEYYESSLGAWYDWQVHLQQAVIAEDPIDYMYEAVFK